MSRAKELDQFFTTLAVAEECYTQLAPILDKLGYDTPFFLEPSAGGGSFVDAVRNHGHEVLGVDIDPKRSDIAYADFLNDPVDNLPLIDRVVIIGNPPFGKRSKLAIDFINTSFEYGETVAFVLPVQFIKHLTQRKIRSDATLVHNEILDPNAFTFEGKPYAVRSVFQVWTLRDHSMHNHRIINAPPTKHDDFDMFLYNCTKEALYMFDLDWNFAVHRQGWSDFQPLENTPELELDRKKQWMFFRSDSDEVLENLRNIDYNKLGERNTSVRGFGKADVVEEYIRLYGAAEDTTAGSEALKTLF